MLIPSYTKQFNKDIKLSKKRQKNIKKLKALMELLIEEKNLPETNRDHKLFGNFAECRECHVEGDWLLIYRVEGNQIFFIRTGTHSDLFK